MSWISMLYQTYNNNADKVGNMDGEKKPLSPVAHMLANVQITITIDDSGTFMEASEVSKKECQTLIPVTEKSSGRSGTTIMPHPLFDTLSYLAGDYEKYAATEKESLKAHEKFEAYLQGLSAWCESEYAHPKACAILKYTKKRTTMYDLIQCGEVKLGEDGKLTKAKIQGTDYEKCTVRYKVLGLSDNTTPEAWEDRTLSDSFIKYYLSMQPGKSDICYVNGAYAVSCVNHPKGIINASNGSNSKLISANDKYGFTYRGRFFTSDEACTVSYDVSQKAHNALKWLVANQGVNFGGRTYLCWNPVGKKIPLNQEFYFGEELEGDTDVDFQTKLRKAFLGYEENLDDNDDIVMLSLDAATPGRLSITCYNELKASEFLRNYKAWCESVKWYIPAKQGFSRREYIATLEIKCIIEYAFGDEHNKKNSVRNNPLNEDNKEILVDDKVLKEHSQRIINCMINRQRVPYDIVHALTVKATNPMAYSPMNRKRVLAYACAMIVKYHNDYNEGVKYGMTLDTENNDRSYLFGRLLAVADKVEQYAMYKSRDSRETNESEDSRETNAIRLRSAFANHPMRTWRTIEESLTPYYAKLKPQTREFYRQISRELLCKIETECTTDKGLDVGLLNKRLEDVYLIGYSHQFRELSNKSNTDK